MESVIYLFLLILGVIVTHDGFSSAATRPSAACFPSIAALVLPPQTDLHFHRAGWGRIKREALTDNFSAAPVEDSFRAAYFQTQILPPSRLPLLRSPLPRFPLLSRSSAANW